LTDVEVRVLSSENLAWRPDGALDPCRIAHAEPGQSFELGEALRHRQS